MNFRFYILALGLILMGCSSDDSGNNNNNNNNNNNQATTAIPDAAFEQALIDLGFDTQIDGEVLTSSIELVTDLIMNDKGISNLAGIQDFTNLENLWLNDNMLTSINVSQNTKLKFLYVERNMLTQISVSTLFDLEKLGLNGNAITELNVSGNFLLQQLIVPDNELANLNVSNNPDLQVLNVIGNPLTCILVSADQLTNTPPGWQKDEEDEYSVTCN